MIAKLTKTENAGLIFGPKKGLRRLPYSQSSPSGNKIPPTLDCLLPFPSVPSSDQAFHQTRTAMNASQFMDKQILGLAAAGAASSPPSTGGGGGGGELLDLMGPNPQEDVVESHDFHARRGANGTGADEVMVPSYDFQPIRTAAAPAPAPAPAPTASASAANAWGSLDSNAASPNLKVILLSNVPAHGAADRSLHRAL